MTGIRMNEEKHYYADAYLQNFEAQIKEVKPSGKTCWLRFDKTIFYPGGGGQSADTGFLDDLPLLEIKEENGHLWHKAASSIVWKEGQMVTLRLDWPRRYYNMQQHTGQHLLSRVLESFDLKTVSVHLGEDYTMIEVEGPYPNEQRLLQIEQEANKQLRRAIPVVTHEISRSEIKRFPLRKPPGAWQRLRVVEIKDFDYSACGGTHVKQTAEIGYIKWLGTEKIRGHARIKWLIGKKADEYIGASFATMQAVKAELQCEPAQFTERITALKSDLKTFRKAADVYKRSHLRWRAAELYNACKNDKAYIVAGLREEETAYLGDLAKILVKEHEQTAFLFTKDRFCLAAPENSPLDTKEFLDAYRETLGLKGGGPPGFVQGAVSNPDEKLIAGCMKVAMQNEQ